MADGDEVLHGEEAGDVFADSFIGDGGEEADDFASGGVAFVVDDEEDGEVDLVPAEVGFVESVEDGEEGVSHVRGGGGY